MGDVCSKTRKGKPSPLCRKQTIIRTEGMGRQKSGHAEKTEAVKEQARGSVNKDALLWAAARASVQLTWFLSSLLSGSSIGDKASSSLASICIYSSIRCMRSYFGGGIPHKLSFLCTALALDLLCVRID